MVACRYAQGRHHQSGWAGFHLTTFTELYYKIYRCNHKNIFTNIVHKIGPMYAWTMLTEFNCQSATQVKNAVVFYYIHAILHNLFNACHVYMWLLFCPFCCAEVALPELLKEPHQPILNFPKRSFGQKKPVHCSFQGKWFSS